MKKDQSEWGGVCQCWDHEPPPPYHSLTFSRVLTHNIQPNNISCFSRIFYSHSTDKWQQAYRFLGVYIDCTHTWGGQGHSHDDNKNNNGEEQEAGCSRWAMWAAVSLKIHTHTHTQRCGSIDLFVVFWC